MSEFIKRIYLCLPFDPKVKTYLKNTFFRCAGRVMRDNVYYKRWKENNEKNHSLTKSSQKWIDFFPVSAINDTFKQRSDNLLDRVVDVIVPIYKGVAETKACIESVLVSNNKCPFRLILINDASPEVEIKEYLCSLPTSESLLVLHNDNNLGFTATVNRGMGLSGINDVLLLNSDTLVANNWLDRIVLQADSDKKIGTVTPYSNNATICSYPDLNGVKDLPFGLTVAEIDSRFESANSGRSCEIPTAVGFCMYIKRKCLDEVGMFDVDAFGKGYGEENDFSLRAMQNGWTNILAADVFVYHAGEVSFANTSNPRKEVAAKIIRDRYPSYENNVFRHIRDDPGFSFRVASTISIISALNIPKVLHLVHPDGGGTLKQVYSIVESQEGINQVHVVMMPSKFCDEIIFKVNSKSIPDGFIFSFPFYEIDLLAYFLDQFKFNLAHVHHLIGYKFDVYKLISKLNLDYYVTAHDYYYICPRAHLFSPITKKYCGEYGEMSCNSCLSFPGVSENNISSWRSKHSELVSNASVVICPTKDVENRFKKYYPVALYKVVPHEEFFENKKIDVRAMDLRTSSSFRIIGILGALGEHKGSQYLSELLFATKASGKNWKYTLVGYLPNTFLGGKIKITGPYDNDQVKKHIYEESLDVIIFLPGCPETYSYTLTEAMLSGKPIVAPNFGAYPERLLDYSRSWLYDYRISAQELVNFIDSIVFNELADVSSCEPTPIEWTARSARVNSYYSSEYLASSHRTSNIDRNSESKAHYMLSFFKKKLSVKKYTLSSNDLNWFSELYMAMYPDIAHLKIAPKDHYLHHGFAEGRQPQLYDQIFPSDDELLDLATVDATVLENFDLKIAVHLHLFYLDLIEEVISYLSNINYKYDLFISICDKAQLPKVERHFSKLPNVGIVVAKHVENRGRDIAPMICVFGKDILAYEFLCHIHTKKSNHNHGLQDWRNYLFNSLLGSDIIINKIIGLLHNKEYGIIFPQSYVMLDYKLDSWGANYNNGLALCSLLGIANPETNYFDYPAGSMFWARVDSISQFFSSGISYDDFELESGQFDQTLSHAVERVLGVLPRSNGYRLGILKDDSHHRRLRKIYFYGAWNN